jgi:hypothetical protein
MLNRNRPNHTSLMACSISSRPSRCAAAPRAGLDPDLRAPSSMLRGRDEEVALQSNKEVHLLLDTAYPHVSNPARAKRAK